MFFSVKTSIKIADKVYSPCICYEAKEALIPTIEKLVADGKAYSFKERVYFQNGRVLVKKAEPKQADSYEEPKRFEKKGKKEKKVPQADTVVDIPSPEEIADNEDF